MSSIWTLSAGRCASGAARKYLRQELNAHIDDKVAELEADGTVGAEAAAIRAMGDPVETGHALNAIHRPRVEWGVIICVLLLSAAGLFTWQFGNTSGPDSGRHILVLAKLSFMYQAPRCQSAPNGRAHVLRLCVARQV